MNSGVWLYPVAPVADLVAAIIAADRAGISEIWIADEGPARDPFIVLAAAAVHTSQVKLGVGITSPLLRHPGALAASAATLDELSDGRAMLGLGVGGVESLDPFHIEITRPVAVLRDAIRTAKAVFGRFESEHFTRPPHASPPRPVPVFVGAKGEQLNRLASREADGVFLSGFDLSALDQPVGWARSVRPIHVALYASVRFAANSPADPSALSGTPHQIATRLALLHRRHRPESLGLALIDGTNPQLMMAQAIETFRLFNKHA